MIAHSMENKHWFAIRTRSNREAVITDSLLGKGFEAWCPRYKTTRSNTVGPGKAVFPGYVFCRLAVSHRMPVLTVPGVVGIVSSGRIPLSIDEKEIESLRIVMESRLPIGPHDYLKAGDSVRIKDGPLTGAEGYIMQKEGEHLVVSITLLQRSVSVSVQGHWLEKCRSVAA
jgi:transcriptional antiterminator NusG